MIDIDIYLFCFYFKILLKDETHNPQFPTLV